MASSARSKRGGCAAGRGSPRPRVGRGRQVVGVGLAQHFEHRHGDLLGHLRRARSGCGCGRKLGPSGGGRPRGWCRVLPRRIICTLATLIVARGRSVRPLHSIVSGSGSARGDGKGVEWVGCSIAADLRLGSEPLGVGPRLHHLLRMGVALLRPAHHDVSSCKRNWHGPSVGARARRRRRPWPWRRPRSVGRR